MPAPTVTVSAGEFSESQKASQRGCAPGLSSHNACNVIQQREFLNCWKTEQSTIPLDGSNSGLKATHHLPTHCLHILCQQHPPLPMEHGHGPLGSRVTVIPREKQLCKPLRLFYYDSCMFPSYIHTSNNQILYTPFPKTLKCHYLEATTEQK